jgi:hypothetical protein
MPFGMRATMEVEVTSKLTKFLLSITAVTTLPENPAPMIVIVPRVPTSTEEIVN